MPRRREDDRSSASSRSGEDDDEEEEESEEEEEDNRRTMRTRTKKGSDDEEDGRKQDNVARGVRALLGKADWRQGVSHIGAQLGAERTAASSRAAAFLVAWEVEREIDGAHRVSVAAKAIQVLDDRLAGLEAWIAESREEIDSMSLFVGKVLTENDALEVERTNLNRLAEKLAGLASDETGLGLTLPVQRRLKAGLPFKEQEESEQQLIHLDDKQRSEIVEVTRELARALLVSASIADDEKRRMRGVGSRVFELETLADSFADSLVDWMAFALRRFGSARRRRSYSSMLNEDGGVLARLTRSADELRRRQEEMHSLLSHHKSLVESLIVLQRPARLATLRESYAKAKCAYLAPILQAYLGALSDDTHENSFHELGNCTAALTRLLDDVLPMIEQERNYLCGFFQLGTTDDPTILDTDLAAQFQDLLKLSVELVRESDLEPSELLAVASLAQSKKPIQQQQQQQQRRGGIFTRSWMRLLGDAAYAQFTAKTQKLAQKIAQCPTKKSSNKPTLAATQLFVAFVDSLVTRCATTLTTFDYDRHASVLDPALSSLGAAVLEGWLERAAKANVKYADVLRLENTVYLEELIHAGALGDRAFAGSKALRNVVKAAEDLSTVASRRYVGWMFAYELGPLSKFFGRLEAQLAKREAFESKEDLLKIYNRLSIQTVTTSVRAICERLEKHFGVHPSRKLRDEMRRTVLDNVLSTWKHYDALSQRHYSVPIKPPVVEVRQLLRTFTTPGTTPGTLTRGQSPLFFADYRRG